MLVFVGFLIIIVMMLLIFKSKALPAFCFVVLPIIGALACGFGLADIGDFISKGVGSTWQTAVLFIFSVSYFGIMNDAGLFDKLVAGLVKMAGKNITLILICTSIIAMIGHLDGAAAVTYLITIPTMLPIYKRLHIRPTILLLLCGAATGIMNLVPWGGPTIRAATTAGVDATQMWIAMIPMQVFGLACLVFMAVFLGMAETKRLGKLGFSSDGEEVGLTEKEGPDLSLKRPGLLWFNLAFTVILIAALIEQWLPTYAIFMVGTIIALAVNYPDPQLQQKRLQAHAPSSIMLTITLLSAGIFLGVMTQSGMVLEMSKLLIGILPVGLQRYLHYIVGALGAPLGMVLGPDPYYYGIMPIIGQIVHPFGISMETVGRAILIGENVGLSVSPVVPPTFLAIGLAGVDLKEHIKFSFLPLWGLSVVMLLFAVFMRII